MLFLVRAFWIIDLVHEVAKRVMDDSYSSTASSNSDLSSLITEDSDSSSITFELSGSDRDCDSSVSGASVLGTNADDSSGCPTTPAVDDAVDPLEQPLYDGADITLWDTYVLLMQHSLRHSLTKQAFSDLLKVVGLLLPSKCMVSYYKLRKYFLDMYGNIGFSRCYCCATCHSSIPAKGAVCGNGCADSVPFEFLVLSLESQLKRKLEGECNFMQYSKKHVLLIFYCVLSPV